tara:strand:+ start:404 stop:616 length:213 start_codon:yes stop_codon:yes gene_type:complete
VGKQQMKNKNKDKKKSKWQEQREKEVSKNSQFDPEIHQLGREGYGFGMKRDYKAKPEELSGKNLPFKSGK